MTQYTVLIVELRNIIFRLPSKLDIPVPLRTLDIISHNSNSWFQYEKGDISEYDCYTRAAAEYNLDKTEFELAVKKARAALTADPKLFALLQKIKAAFNLQIIVMTNISSSDDADLRARPADWGIFDHVFTSHAVGERKPSLNFFKYVLKALDVDPTKVILVDDRFDNVFAARSLGVQGVLFETSDALERTLLNFLGNAVKRGQDFLRCNAGVLDCISKETEEHPSQVVDENWTQLLILEATGDRSLVDFIEREGKWNFFKADAQLTTKYYPDDLDTTAVALSILKPSRQIAIQIMDEMLKYVTSDGIFPTYFNTERPRVDAGICVDILTLFYAYGCGDKVRPTLLWVRDILKYRAYLDGTKYFNTPEIFLWLLTRLLSCSTDPELHLMLDMLLKERVQERIGAAGDALALAMRILVCNFVGIRDEIDLRTLFTMQCIDGGWEIGWMYHYPTAGVSIGNRGLTTALAIKAIEVSSNPLPKRLHDLQSVKFLIPNSIASL